jgi:hypothetical protein
MRLRRGLAGHVLPCGCLVGVYETYGGKIVATFDWLSDRCNRPDHQLHISWEIHGSLSVGLKDPSVGPRRPT